MHTLFPMLAAAQSGGVSSMIHNVLKSLPNDPASLFTLILALGLSGLVVVSGMKTSEKEPEHENGKRKLSS